MAGRLEKATFWATVAGVLVAIAALLVAVGVVNTSGDHFREPWFGIGIGVGVVAVILLLVAVVMGLRHRGDKEPTLTITIPKGSTIETRGVAITLSEKTVLVIDGKIDAVPAPTRPEPEPKARR